MPGKFSCRQLRETGQCFESFLVVRGLDMETDREQLRTIYNRDFKIRYGPAHSPALNRGPSRDPYGGATLPARGAEGHSSRSGAGWSRGGADLPSRAVPTPRPRRPEPARSAPAGPLRRVPAESLPRSRALGAPGLGRGPAATRCSKGA